MALLNDIFGINNPYYRLIPELRSNLVAATPDDYYNLYSTHQINAVIVDDPEAPWYVREAAKYDLAALNDMYDDDIIWERSTFANKYQGKGKGKRMMFHQNYLRMCNLAGVGSQLTGDCVSWAIRFALELLRTQNIHHGEWEEFHRRQATAGIYSGRGHTGEGANPARLTAYACQIGTLFEEIYLSGKYDFTDYANYVRWGISRGRSGMPEDLLELTKPYHAKSWKIITTVEGLMDAWAAGEDEGGCQIHCGSNIGVARAGNPISNLSGSWAHDMGMSGYDDTGEFFPFAVFAWDQSWGAWNNVTNVPTPWQPMTQGMFFLAEASMPRALNAQGTCAFFGFEGKPAPPSNLLW